MEYLEYKADLSVSQKADVIIHNAGVAKKLQLQLSFKPNKPVLVNTSCDDYNVPEVRTTTEEPKSFDETFLALYQALLNTPKEFLFQTISELISPSDPAFFNYINMLKIRLYQDLVEASNLAYLTNSVDDPELTEMYNVIQDIISFLDELEEEQELIAAPNKKNTIFFMTSLNRVDFYEDVDKDIPTDMRGQVLELLNSLINGEYKRLKYLHSKKYFEVRSEEIRITFAKLRNNNLLLLSCFLKKTTTNRNYREMMYRVRDQYLFQKPWYLERIDDPEFIALHQKYLDDVVSLCEGKKRGRYDNN